MYEYVQSTPLCARDPLGLELVVRPPDEFGPITLDFLFEQREFDLGVLKAVFSWRDDGPWVYGISWVAVPRSICEDCRFYFVTCTIKREAVGFTQIQTTKIRPSKEYPANPFAALIAELNRAVLLEETLHQEATHRWIRDHQQTGFGMGCSEAEAAVVAGTQALRRVKTFETRAVQLLEAENALIDYFGFLWRADIIRRIEELKASMN